MNRPPWAPLNAGVFLIVLGGVFLVSFFQVIDIYAAFPLIFAVFGVWLLVEAFTFPPANPYEPPKGMVAAWGALIGMLGFLWFIGAKAPGAFPLALVVVVIVAGIGAVGYSFTRASHPSTAKATP